MISVPYSLPEAAPIPEFRLTPTILQIEVLRSCVTLSKCLDLSQSASRLEAFALMMNRPTTY